MGNPDINLLYLLCKFIKHSICIGFGLCNLRDSSRCKVCGADMKFTEKNIRHHIKFTHAMGWVQYKARFLDDVGPQVTLLNIIN